MIAKAWNNGTSGLGLRFNAKDRAAHFSRHWANVQIEIAGNIAEFPIRPSFWRSCPEIRGGAIAAWLRANDLAGWPKGNPPAVELIPSGERRFVLVER